MIAQIPSYVPWMLPLLVIGIVVQFFWQSATSFMLYKLSKQDRGAEAMEKRLHDQTVASVDERHNLTSKLLDERYRAMSHEIAGHVQALVSTVDLMKSRLQDGDEHFEGLDDKAQKLEIAAVGRIDSLKDYMRENLASKRDLERHQESMGHKLAMVDGHLADLGKDVAVLKSQQGVKRGGQA
jgi:hypothetical protein